MSTRENTLAILLLALVFLGGGGLLGYTMILSPLWDKEKAADALNKDIEDLTVKVAKLRKDEPRLQVANKRSLPTDENVAREGYKAMLERLLRQAHIPDGFTINDKKITEVKGSSLPGQQAKKAPYTRVALEITFKKADMWAVHDFLTAYYKLNLLQQITALTIKREDDAAAGAKKGNNPDRKDLTVVLTTEALILEGADPRRTLLPVPPAFAAVGGFAGYQTIALTPEASRGITPTQFVQVLASRPRDYSLIVRNDPFHGPYVDPVAPTKKPGDGLAKKPVKEDISNSIILGGVVPGSDRTAFATIRDSYNPFNYVIEATAKGITVQKFYFVGKNKKRDTEYPHNDMLVISDGGVSITNRTFKVVEVDVEGLILVDLTPPAKPDAKAEAKGTRAEAPMPRPGQPGRTPPASPPGRGPALAAPLAGVVGAAAASGGQPPSRVYRWAVGKPLKALTEIPQAEAEKVLERVATEGPVRLVAAAP
jgi:hypothetical protein